MVIEPWMATVESARRYQVVSDDMQATRLLAWWGGRLLARAARLGQSAKASRLRKTVAFLARVPLFQDLKKRQLRSLARWAIPRHYASGEAIVRQGKSGIGLFIVVSGKAEAVRTRRDGTRVVVNAFVLTDFFGELALLNDEPRTASVIALEDTECLALVHWNFRSMLAQYGEMTAVILQEQSRRFQRAMSVL
ncbi:MAG: cyclic nucleotide-binding domain-containing protein [Anaerolineae bacterium]|nr:cyclic nucleotide-binding domain-containing protein [Anaerolineae bacterium]